MDKVIIMMVMMPTIVIAVIITITIDFIFKEIIRNEMRRKRTMLISGWKKRERIILKIN